MAYDPKLARRTGRTTRLLDEAIGLAKQGRYVIAYAVNENNVQWLYDFLCDRQEVEPTMEPVGGHKVYIGPYGSRGSISIVYQGNLFDRTRRAPHKSVIELIDPSFVEAHFQAQLKALHKYDLLVGESLKPDWKVTTVDRKDCPVSEEINSGPLGSIL